MKIAAVLHWKTNDAPGLRCFSNPAYARHRVERDGKNPASLRLVRGVWVFWPDALGAFPSPVTLAQWEAEFDAQPIAKTLEQRIAILEARIGP